jgi:hypothetical protein
LHDVIIHMNNKFCRGSLKSQSIQIDPPLAHSKHSISGCNESIRLLLS